MLKLLSLELFAAYVLKSSQPRLNSAFSKGLVCVAAEIISPWHKFTTIGGHRSGIVKNIDALQPDIVIGMDIVWNIV